MTVVQKFLWITSTFADYQWLLIPGQRENSKFISGKTSRATYFIKFVVKKNYSLSFLSLSCYLINSPSSQLLFLIPSPVFLKGLLGLDIGVCQCQFQDTTDALPCHINLPVCLCIVDPNSRAPKKNTSDGNEVLPQLTTHLIQRQCYQRGSPCQDPASNWTTRRPPDDRR